MAWFPQRQSPLRRQYPGLPIFAGMPGQIPLTPMVPGLCPNPGLPLQLGRDPRFNNPIFANRVALGDGGMPFNPVLGQAMQRGFVPPMNPNLSLSSFQTPLQPCYDPRFFNQPQSCFPCCEGNSNKKRDYDFKLKDVTVRGKARAVRASFLIEAPKFEADLVKYMDKKKEDDVPEEVVDMLISWINTENYKNSNPFDEVTLHILASNVGCKSVLEQSIARLKTMQSSLVPDELVKIIGTIFLSSRVDGGLKKWLVKLLKERNLWKGLYTITKFNAMVMERPEVEAELVRELGVISQPDDEGLRTL